MEPNDENSGRLTENVFNNDENPEIPEQLSNSQKHKNTTQLMILVGVILFIITAIAVVLVFTLKTNNDENEKNEFVPYYPIPENEDLIFTEEAHRLLSREIATQSMVLATNNDILPLKSTDQVVLFGLGTAKTYYGGQGSGEVYNKGTATPLTPVMVLEGIKNKADRFKYIENDIGYELGTGVDTGKNLTDDDIKNFSVKKDGAERSVAILTISRRSGEGDDRPQDSSATGTLLSQRELDTFYSIKNYFDKIVLVLNVPSVIELNDTDKDVNVSILIAFLPGMEAGNAIADILVGDVNPSGHLTDTWAKEIKDYPTTSTFLENKKYVKYKEGLFVGYRFFEFDPEFQKKVVFPFGYGLSYTTFKIESKCEFVHENKLFKIVSNVTNMGNRAGKQVVQVYVKKPQNEKFIKALRELVAFGKTKELQPGESQDLELSFELNYLASYDDIGVTGNPACYVLEKGNYDIYVGDSVMAVRNEENKIYTYTQDELVITERLINRLTPKDPEVADANTKPNFADLFFVVNDKNNEYEEEYQECINNNINNYNNINIDNILKKLKETSSENKYNILPTDNINEINFKTVLQKKYSMDQLVDTMSNEELAFLSFGKPGFIRHGTGIIGGYYNSGITGKYNIPFGDTNDGPAGLRQSEVKMGSTAWPCSTALASTFDVEILRRVGEETGKEARKIGTTFWLAPGMNIHRSPLCGRNFEYYSEDPLLSGKMAAAITQGLQSKRVSITLKHFFVNNKEGNRNGDSDPYYLASDSRLAERVAREIYLKGFEIAVKEGKPWAIMSSYNRMNSMKTAESYVLLTEILRKEWGFEGLVMTDWNTKSHNDVEAHSGSSVKMPDNKEGVDTIMTGLIKGTVTRDELKRNIKYMFNTLAKTACIDSLFKEPDNKIIITNKTMKIKIYDNAFRKYTGISFDNCTDEDGGFILINTTTNSWITLFIDNQKEHNRKVRIRYASVMDGFGVEFKKYGEHLGEITNLEQTGNWNVWNTSCTTNINLPEGKYELTMRFLGYTYTVEKEDKGRVNWIEFLEY